MKARGVGFQMPAFTSFSYIEGIVGGPLDDFVTTVLSLLQMQCICTTMNLEPMKTLAQFVRESGGRAKAAVAIGVAETTLWRWSEGKARPRGLALWRLRELGIDLEQAARPDKIERVIRVRPAAEAFEKNEEEMLLGMLSMSARDRVADVDAMRIRLGSLHVGGSRPSQMRKVVRIARRNDARS